MQTCHTPVGTLLCRQCCEGNLAKKEEGRKFNTTTKIVGKNIWEKYFGRIFDENIWEEYLGGAEPETRKPAASSLLCIQDKSAPVT